MKNTLIASAIAVAATLAAVSSASAVICPPGYKPVKIQGHWICQLDVQASNKLKAKTKPGLNANASTQLQSAN